MKKVLENKYDIKQGISNKGFLCVTSDNILASIEAVCQCFVILTVSNSLPGSDIFLVANDNVEYYLLVFWDTCDATNTRNLVINQWIITQLPHLVQTY